MAYPVPMWAGANLVESGFPDYTPSIATQGLGNYDYAMLMATYKNITVEDTVYITSDGSGFSRTAEPGPSLLQLSVSASGFAAWVNDTSAAVIIYNGCYLRTLNPTPSFVWAGQNVAYSLSNSCTLAIDVGVTYLTVQDATTIAPGSSDYGITSGDFLQLFFGGGRGSILYPQSGDTMEWEVKGSDGTDDFVCQVEVTFTA